MALAAFMFSMNVNAQEPKQKAKKRQLNLKNHARLQKKNRVVLKQNQVDVVHLKKLLRKNQNSFYEINFKTLIFSGRFLS